MARKAKPKVEEIPLEDEQSLAVDVIAEEEELVADVEELTIEEEPIVEEKPVVVEELPKRKPFIVDNYMADTLFEKLYARAENAYEYIIVTADLSYIRGRATLLYQFVMRMLKSQGVAKFPKNYFNSLVGATLKNDFWVVTKE